MASAAHYFFPPGEEIVAYLDGNEWPFRWARCSDSAFDVERAAVIFHTQVAPLDVEGVAKKCLLCGERNVESSEMSS